VSDGFAVRKASNSLFGCPAPRRDCLANHPGLSEVVGEDIRLLLHDVGRLVGDGGGNACMQLLALALQQGSVGRVLNQGVLQRVARERW
jgi:hypothetical protein